MLEKSLSVVLLETSGTRYLGYCLSDSGNRGCRIVLDRCATAAGNQCLQALFMLRGWKEYRSIQIYYRQRFFLGGMNFRLQIQNRTARRINSIAETDLWEFQQKISHYRHRFSLEFQLISITDTDFGLKTN